MIYLVRIKGSGRLSSYVSIINAEKPILAKIKAILLHSDCVFKIL